jgi:Uma2 family endonuclease
MAVGFYALIDKNRRLAAVNAAATRKCDLKLSSLVPTEWHVQNQEPITLDTSEPEPDVTVVRGKLDDFNERHPGPGEIALVVEVSDTTLITDRFKAEIYSAAGIPVYWIINLPERTIEVYSKPNRDTTPPRYGLCTTHSGEDVVPLIVADEKLAQIHVSELLP